MSPEFIAAESYVSPRERAWLRWTEAVERLLGHSLDGDQQRDGYSLDYAYDAFDAGDTPAQYFADIVRREA